MPPIYHRLQSAAENDLMERTGKVGGRPMRNISAGLIPCVKAYLGPLESGQSGIEFTTSIPHDAGCPPGIAYWSEGRPGVEVIEKNELVAIAVTILKRQD